MWTLQDGNLLERGQLWATQIPGAVVWTQGTALETETVPFNWLGKWYSCAAFFKGWIVLELMEDGGSCYKIWAQAKDPPCVSPLLTSSFLPSYQSCSTSEAKLCSSSCLPLLSSLLPVLPFFWCWDSRLDDIVLQLSVCFWAVRIQTETQLQSVVSLTKLYRALESTKSSL